MFCSNCGSKVPDGSKFCSVCGNRLVEIEPAGREDFSYAGNGIADAEKNVNKVSFDWSNVIEEPVKKNIPNDVRSPWDDIQVEERPRVEKPSVDHRRTMSFIEILKQEREEKLQAAEAEARAYTERQEAAPDYSAFENAPEIYQPKVYEDMTDAVADPIEESYDRVNFEEPTYEEPKYDEPYSFEKDVEEPEVEPQAQVETEPQEQVEVEPQVHVALEPQVEPQLETSEPAEQIAPLYSEYSDSYVKSDPAGFELAQESKVEDLYDENTASSNDLSSLEAELDEILKSKNFGRVSRAERNAEAEAAITEEEVETEPVEEAFSSAELETEPVEETFSNTESETEPVEEAPLTLEELITEEEPKPERATIAPPADTESEIDELKRRLATLMGAPEEPVDLTREEPKLEDYDASILEPAQAVEEPQEVKDDALSIDDLERDLFGEETIEDIEAEATKKIDKFYTLYKKNEEFQRLLDEEYNKLKEEDTQNQAEAEVVEMPVIEKYEPTPEPAPVPEAESVPVVAEIVTPQPAEVVPAVEAKPVAETVAPVVETAAPVVQETASDSSKKDEKAAAKEAKQEAKAAAKQAKKDAKAAAKQAKKEGKAEADGDEEEGGGALTVLAVIIAILLVILLGIILILNFAPDSGIAMAIDSAIENIASYFSAGDTIKGVLL